MRKIIALGECVLDVIFNGDKPETACPGGRLLNAAASLGRIGHTVTYVSEAARDFVGDRIVDFLKQNNVETRSIDRYTEGHTPVSLVFKGAGEAGTNRTMRYGGCPPEGFNAVWPRIDADDIVIFGTYFSLDPRVRTRLFDLVRHAVERKAVIMYLPGFSTENAPHITMVKPAILENFEVTDIVVSRSRDLAAIFSSADDARAYKDNVAFYCRNMVNLDRENSAIRFFHERECETRAVEFAANPLGFNAGAIAGLVDGLIDLDIKRDDLASLDREMLASLLDRSVRWASLAAASPDNVVPADVKSRK